MSIQQMDYICIWLDSVFRENSQCEGTLVQYKQIFQKFLNFTGKTSHDIVADYETAENERRIRRDYGRLVRAFASHLHHNEDYAPATIAKYIACVKSFFAYIDLPLPKIGLGRRIVSYGNRDIQKEEIMAILQNVKFLRDKAFFMMMSQSGLRPFELCSLKMQDIEDSLNDVQKKCYAVRVPQQIAKGKYHEFFTFIPHETMRLLREYWDTRLDSLNEGSYVFVKERGKKVAPTNGGAMSQAFRKIAEKLEQAGVLNYQVRKGKPSQLRLYNLRKWFRKQSYQAGSDFVNFWMGHTNLDLEHYFSKDVNLHRKVYEEKALPFLQLEAQTLSETAIIVAQQTEEIKDLKRRLAETTEVKKELANLKQFTKKLLERVEAVEERDASISSSA